MNVVLLTHAISHMFTPEETTVLLLPSVLLEHTFTQAVEAADGRMKSESFQEAGSSANTDEKLITSREATVLSWPF